MVAGRVDEWAKHVLMGHRAWWRGVNHDDDERSPIDDITSGHVGSAMSKYVFFLTNSSLVIIADALGRVGLVHLVPRADPRKWRSPVGP